MAEGYFSGLCPNGERIPVTNDEQTIEQLLTDPLREALGELQFREILCADAFLYFEFGSPPDELGQGEVDDDESEFWLRLTRNSIVSILKYFNSFSMCLWALADSCVYADEGWCLHHLRCDKGFITGTATTAIHFSATGERHSTEYSLSDWERAQQLHDTWRSALARACGASPKEEDLEEIITRIVDPQKRELSLRLAAGPSTTRLSRFHYFLQSARGTSDLCMKIALHFTALEALFIGKNPSELVHKIAERTACFLEQDSASKVECFQFVKRAYNVRSKTVHGSRVSDADLKALDETARRLDHLMRRIFGRLVSEPEALEVFLGNPDEIEDYFLRKALSQHSHSANSNSHGY